MSLMLTDIILIFGKTTNNYILIMRVCERNRSLYLVTVWFLHLNIAFNLNVFLYLNYLQIVCYNFIFGVKINWHYNLDVWIKLMA